MDTQHIGTASSKVERMQATPPRGEPDKLAIEARKEHFEGIYRFAPRRLSVKRPTYSRREHSITNGPVRCANHIPQWIGLVKAGDIDAAWEAYQTNCLPEITEARLSAGPAMRRRVYTPR